MGEYNADPYSLQCLVICGGGCSLTCVVDSGIPVFDAVGIAMSINSDFDS